MGIAMKGPGPSGAPGGTMSAVFDDKVLVDFSSPSARSIERIIAEIGPTTIPLLIVGESGSGKEIVAQQVHNFSRRGGTPLSN